MTLLMYCITPCYHSTPYNSTPAISQLLTTQLLITQLLLFLNSFSLRLPLARYPHQLGHISQHQLPSRPTMPEPKEKRVRHLKLVLLGDSSVGKSCLVLRFVRDEFTEQEPTIGGDFAYDFDFFLTNILSGIFDTNGDPRG